MCLCFANFTPLLITIGANAIDASFILIIDVRAIGCWAQLEVLVLDYPPDCMVVLELIEHDNVISGYV